MKLKYCFDIIIIKAHLRSSSLTRKERERKVKKSFNFYIKRTFLVFKVRFDSTEVQFSTQLCFFCLFSNLLKL